MRKIYLLMLLLVSGYGFAQQQNYIIKISNLNYSINKGVKNKTNSNIRITVRFKDGSSYDAYARGINNSGNSEVNLSIPAFNRNSKPVSIECYAFINFRTGSDANSTISKNVDIFCPSGSFSGTYSPRMSNITFTYKIDPVFSINRSLVMDNILPTHTKKTLIATPGYDPHYYRWQYTLAVNGISTIWIDLPQYDNASSITVDAVDILKEKTYLNIGKNINFRIKPCTETPGLSTPLSYSIRLSAPQILSAASFQPFCSNSEDGSINLVFNRNLLDGEKLNYTLIDSVSGTPYGNNGILAIDDNKTFNISGLPPSTYSIQLIGFKDGLNTSVMPADLFALTTFKITAPTPVDFSLVSTNVRCKDGKDGSITINASGGTNEGYEYSLDGGNNWIPFDDNKINKQVLKGLYIINNSPAVYVIKVKDKNGCIAKESDKEKEETITISEPTAALKLEYTLKQDPSFFGAANGKIVAAITGGTIKDDHTYNFEWKDKDGNSVPAIGQYNADVKTYYITLNAAIADSYKLTVTDKNYSEATNKAGCSIIESEQKLIQPDPIKIILNQTQAISCSSLSLDPLGNGNKIADGILTAIVTGGIQFTGSANNGLPYKFIWSKYNVITDSWEILSDRNIIKAENLTKGKYSLNVEDAKGTVQGTYSTTKLELAKPTEFEIKEPSPIIITFTSSDVACYQGNNGFAEANVEGGAGSYTYKWFNTGEGIVNQNKIKQLVAGNYTVEVADINGCFAKASIDINEPPSSLSINYKDIITPTFAGATNGKITAEVSGGTAKKDASYNYVWTNAKGIEQTAVTAIINGVFTITLDNLGADDYFLTVKDENYDTLKNQIINCSVLESKVTLNEPEPLKVVFEIKNTISCNSANQFGNNTDVSPNDGQRDESQDGILIAHVAGGTPLAATANNGLSYYFYWKKQQQDGSWVDLMGITGETASNLSAGNYALNVKDRNGIVLGTYYNNQLIKEIDAIQFIQEPSKLSVTITKGDVFCNGGYDGWATANVVGGTPPYNYNWSNGVLVSENTILKAGKYVINITDAKGCATQNEVTIIEPIDSIVVKVEKIINPSFYQATNGKITVTVKGGTLFPDNSYWFEWKNSRGVVQKSTATTFMDGVYTITLSDLPEETYNLTIRDTNYSLAKSKMGCTVLNTMVSLEDPDPLEVTFEIVNTISCHVDNDFGNEKDTAPADSQRDESQDGILVAHVKGGIKLETNQNNGLPYYYTWKKQNGGGSWSIWDDQDETAQNVPEGNYALNIEDANGIKLGTYINNVLVKEVDVTQYMKQPDKLNLTFTKLDVGCTAADDGWAEAHVTGGTAPYSFQWTNEATTPRIDYLTANNYFVLVTDAKGCSIQGSIFVGDPEGVIATETIKNPTCFQGNDGSINLDVNGGNLPYTYKWSTGATTKNVQNLSAGNYEVEILCPDCCVYKKKFVLKNPDPIIVNVGEDRTLCDGQTLDVDATNAIEKAKYSWTSTNGFTSNEAKVTLSKAGTYHIKVSSVLGCIGEDEITIKTSQNAISSEFLLSSQAYLDEEVILVNTSDPFGESSKWKIPSGVTIVEQKEKYITLKFDTVGTYALGLQQTQGDCFAMYTKNIVVEERNSIADPSSNSKFITDFIVAPNPSDGNFKAFINFEEVNAFNLRLFSGSGQFTTIQKKASGKKKYEVDFNTTLAAGMYILVLETEQQTLVKKIIIY